jgi:hypothetical protein
MWLWYDSLLLRRAAVAVIGLVDIMNAVLTVKDVHLSRTGWIEFGLFVAAVAAAIVQTFRTHGRGAWAVALALLAAGVALRGWY